MSRSSRVNPAVTLPPSERLRAPRQDLAEKARLPGDDAAAPAMSPSDAADLDAARCGDHAAFGRLYDRHAPVVLALCRRLSAAEAEDSTQETFLRAHRNLAKVQGPEKLRPWLYAIARRVCSERRRAGRRRHRHEGSAMSRAVHDGGVSNDAALATESAEELRRLDAALGRLDDRERLAIHLYYLDADPLSAAASAMGLSRSGYYKLLARARERLADLMKTPS